MIKRIDDLIPADLGEYPIWEFVSSSRKVGGLAVRPIRRVPVRQMSGKIVGTLVILANGSRIWALIGNIDEAEPQLTLHFLTISVFHGDRWFPMARYHDYDYNERGPRALAEFLKLTVDEVFPISYDIRDFCIAKSGVLVGKIEAEPTERLTREEIIGLAVPKNNGNHSS